MKKIILTVTLSVMLAFTGLTTFAQEQPVPKKDTVNIDTEAKPTVYYDIEDDSTDSGESKGRGGMIAIIAGAVVIVAGVVVLVTRKKKK